MATPFAGVSSRRRSRSRPPKKGIPINTSGSSVGSGADVGGGVGPGARSGARVGPAVVVGAFFLSVLGVGGR